MERKEKYRFQAEKMLSDYEFFSSPRFMRVLHHVGKEITDRHNAKIRTYAEQGENRAGYFEGVYTYINVLNEITQSFPTLELRGESILGVVGHECGHQNYSSIYLRRKYVEGIENGILYPYFPEPNTEKEQIYADQMKQLFTKKDKATLACCCTSPRVAGGCIRGRTHVKTVSRKYPKRDLSKSETDHGTIRKCETDGQDRRSIGNNVMGSYRIYVYTESECMGW